MCHNTVFLSMKGHVDRMSDARFRDREVYLATLENQGRLGELLEPDWTVLSFRYTTLTDICAIQMGLKKVEPCLSGVER